MLLPILLIGVVFYLLIIRPSRARQKKQQELLSTVQPGARIMTTAGLYGTVVEVEDDDISVEIAPGVVIRMVKAAIGRVLTEPESPELEAAEPDGSHEQIDAPPPANPDDKS